MKAIPHFKNCTTQINFNNNKTQKIATTPVQQTPKTINKKKLAVSTAAGLGVTALAVGGLLYKRKIDNADAKKLVKSINFESAESLKEAVEFGKKNLGIKKYRGFKKADLDVVNWVNEALVNINNVTKGKVIMPNKITYLPLEGSIAGAMDCNNANLTIGKNHIESIKNIVKHQVSISAKNTGENPDKMLEPYYRANNFKNWQNSYIAIVDVYSAVMQQLGIETFSPSSHVSTFGAINHEMGHLQHFNNVSLNMYRGLRKIEDTAEKNITPEVQKMRDLFNSKIDVAKSVSEYAATSPLEFVAECFSMMIDEKTMNKTLLSPEARELYTKLGGVAV